MQGQFNIEKSIKVIHIEPGLAIHFLYIIHVLMPFSLIIPASLSHKVQKTVLYICVSFAISHTGLSFSSVQSLSRVQLFATPWTVARQASLSITNSRSLLKFMFIESVMPFNHLVLCPLLPLQASIFPSIRVFSNESALRIRWPKYWSFSFNISPSNEYSWLIAFRMDWLDLLAVQGTLKRIGEPVPQFKSINSLALTFLYIEVPE